MEEVTIRPWGNSQGIRLSKSILEKAGMKVEDTLVCDVSKNRIVIRKAFRHKTLEERMEEYDGKIEVCAYDWGEPEGREIM